MQICLLNDHNINVHAQRLVTTSDKRLGREEKDLIGFTVKFNSIRYNQSTHIFVK